jgi:hypothetical protein
MPMTTPDERKPLPLAADFGPWLRGLLSWFDQGGWSASATCPHSCGRSPACCTGRSRRARGAGVCRGGGGGEESGGEA